MKTIKLFILGVMYISTILTGDCMYPVVQFCDDVYGGNVIAEWQLGWHDRTEVSYDDRQIASVQVSRRMKSAEVLALTPNERADIQKKLQDEFNVVERNKRVRRLIDEIYDDENEFFH